MALVGDWAAVHITAESQQLEPKQAYNFCHLKVWAEKQSDGHFSVIISLAECWLQETAML